jgi:AraC-like DNA-binding protein
MHDCFAEPLTLDEIAGHAEVDKFHLCRAFRDQLGVPPHAYLTQLRIRRAKELLVAGVTPSDVASRVGLYDQSALNRHFRRIVGTTPGQFAKRSTLRAGHPAHPGGNTAGVGRRNQLQRLSGSRTPR